MNSLQRPNARLFELAVASVQDYAIFLLDTQGRVVSWNNGAQRIKGYAEHEIVGRHFSTFYTEPDKARRWPDQELRRATLDGRFEDEGWRVRKDGSRFWANVIITALRDDQGILLGFSKITRDLTDRKRDDERLRQSEERFRLLVERVQDYAIYMLSPEGVVTSWNQGARHIKGYAAEEVIGTHFSRFFTDEDISAGKPWIELAMARERGRVEAEGWRVRRDGSRFWARVVLTALYDDDGTLRGFAKVTQDLTRQKHSDALEEAAMRINDFIAVLAHELRNPLAPIRHAARLMETIKPGDAQFEFLRKAVDRQSQSLARIVDDLLDIGRITHGTFEIEREKTDLSDIVSRAVEAAQPGAKVNGQAISVDMPEEPVFVEADAGRLIQALTNLLNNAVRYSDPGMPICVRVSLEDGAVGTSVARIAVKDRGHGITPELLESIFGMFVQGRDVLGRKGAGLGVGLALARTIVELHHGTLEAKSEGPGKGSEFIMRIPVMQAGEEPQAAAEQGPANHAASGPRKRVLVVDDNVDAAELLASVLRRLGHEVTVVNDGRRALQMVEGYRPHVLFLDIGMPGMNGYEVARRVRERRRSPAPMIVAITGWGQPEYEERSREAGFDAHLVKPVEEPAIRDILTSRSLH